MTLKLGPKFIVFLLVGLLPSLLAIGFLAHEHLQGLMLKQIHNSLDNNLIFARNYLEREKFHVQDAAGIISTDPILSQALDQYDGRGVNSHLNQIVQAYKDLNYLILIDKDRSVFAVNTIGADNKIVNSEELLGQTVKQHPLFISLESSDTNYSTPGFDPFLAIFGLSVSGVSQWFSEPIVVRGETLGWIVLSYKWKQHTETLQRNLIELLVNSGEPALSSRIINEDKVLMSGYSETVSDTLERTLPIVINDTEFTLVIQFNQKSVIAALNQQRDLLLSISVPIILALLVSIYYFMVKQILNPIRRLDDGAQHFTDGDLYYRLPEEGHDELAELSRTFNGMGQELVNAKENLEAQVDTRTKELTESNSQLELAIMAAEQANISKSAFLASMSHEIRTPMNGVLGMLSLLENSGLSKQQARHIDMASSSAESLLGLIDDILDFSKIEAGKLTLESIDFNLLDQLSEFSEVMACRLEGKDVQLVLDVSDVKQTMVKGDPGRLRQILTNLVGNAIKFTSHGEIVVKAALATEDDDHSQYRFHCSVSDTGIGIPQHKLSNLFSVFTQVDESTTRQYGGTGLGLSIVKQLSELMGGNVNVSSDEGKGSCFEFSVNLIPSEKVMSILPTAKLPNMSVLIADSNAVQRKVLRNYLEQWEISVTEVDSSLSVLSILESQLTQPFDLVIIDEQLAGINGEELGASVAKDTRFNDTNLILMTSLAQGKDKRSVSSEVFSSHCYKPTTPPKLFDAIMSTENGKNAVNREKMNAPEVNRKPLKACKSLSELKILLVDDNIINQEVGLGFLEFFGCQSDVVENGAEAINALISEAESTPYDLVLMDCHMPVMDGYEATQFIRTGTWEEQVIPNASIPIIAMTANAMKGDREKCIEAGMDDYLSKPVDANALRDKLSLWMQTI